MDAKIKQKMNKTIINLGKLLEKMERKNPHIDKRDGSQYAAILSEMQRLRDTIDRAEDTGDCGDN